MVMLCQQDAGSRAQISYHKCCAPPANARTWVACLQDLVITVLIDIARGMHYIHTKHIIHGK
jgi:hypothetical protein